MIINSIRQNPATTPTFKGGYFTKQATGQLTLATDEFFRKMPKVEPEASVEFARDLSRKSNNIMKELYKKIVLPLEKYFEKKALRADDFKKMSEKEIKDAVSKGAREVHTLGQIGYGCGPCTIFFDKKGNEIRGVEWGFSWDGDNRELNGKTHTIRDLKKDKCYMRFSDNTHNGFLPGVGIFNGDGRSIHIGKRDSNTNLQLHHDAKSGDLESRAKDFDVVTLINRKWKWPHNYDEFFEVTNGVITDRGMMD